MEKKEEKIKKLKNKKKDIISLTPQIPQNYEKTKNNSINDNKKINEQPLSSKLPNNSNNSNINNNNNIDNIILFELNKTNTFLMDKILFQFNLLLSLSNKVNEKLCKLICPFLSNEIMNNILEERESKNICGNFLCGKIIKKSNKIEYNIINDSFTKESLSKYFCSKECFDIFKKFLNLSQKNFNYLNLLRLDIVYMFSILKNFFEENSYLNRISDLSENLLSIFLRYNIKNIEIYNKIMDNELINIAKYFIEDFDEVFQIYLQKINKDN